MKFSSLKAKLQNYRVNQNGPMADMLIGQENKPLGDILANQSFRDAAVLVAIQPTKTGFSIILTQRAANLSHHAGQVSFPGGRLEKEETADYAACREADEEIGLNVENITLLGQLDTYYTVTGFRVFPYVGFVAEDWQPVVNRDEVEKLFYLPLTYLLNDVAFDKAYYVLKGQRRYYYKFQYEEFYIWGATAAMLKNFSQILK